MGSGDENAWVSVRVCHFFAKIAFHADLPVASCGAVPRYEQPLGLLDFAPMITSILASRMRAADS